MTALFENSGNPRGGETVRIANVLTAQPGGACPAAVAVPAYNRLTVALVPHAALANGELEAHPELINRDPYGGGWLVRLSVAPGASDGLMDAAAYEAFLAEEGAH